MVEVIGEFPSPEYPNSPLDSVVFEIRFPGEPAIECHRDEFFNDAREEFPNVFVPKLQAGEAAALSPYQFQRDDGSARLMMALNLFAYHSSAYPGFPRFRHEVLTWVRTFGKHFRIGRLTRTGLRYVNVIPYAPGAVAPIRHFLNVRVALGDMVESSDFTRLSLTAEVPTLSGGRLTVQVKEVEHTDTSQQAILLDFDFALTRDLHIDNIEQYLDDSHTATKRLFEGLLTERYRRYLQGEGLE